MYIEAHNSKGAIFWKGIGASCGYTYLHGLDTQYYQWIKYFCLILPPNETFQPTVPTHTSLHIHVAYLHYIPMSSQPLKHARISFWISPLLTSHGGFTLLVILCFGLRMFNIVDNVVSMAPCKVATLRVFFYGFVLTSISMCMHYIYLRISLSVYYNWGVDLIAMYVQ